MTKKCSIIIRTKNEERWIINCLRGIFSQNYKDFEVIIVDNQSKDKTLEKAKQYPIKDIVNINNYLPGLALNEGIKKSSGEYIACISAHCIPVNKNWLSILVNNLEKNKKFAGVYGRQQPMNFSPLSDKRDLLIVFGLDRKIQKKDSFFHNANSIIRRSCWKQCNFDEMTTNIEDRIWAQKILNLGYQILYEPEASVYHYHGIHQGGDLERLNNVVKIVEKHNVNYNSGLLRPDKLNICAIIPKKGTAEKINNKYQIQHTIDTLKKSKYVTDIIVSTDNQKTAKIANSLGAKAPFLREKELSDEVVNLETVYAYTIDKIEEKGIIYDLVVLLEETYPFRPDNLIDDMIRVLLQKGLDCIIAAKKEPGWAWQEINRGEFKRLDSGDMPRKFKKNILIGMHGLGIVTYPTLIREKSIFEYKTGLFEINDPLANIEIRTSEDIKSFKPIIEINL